MNSLPPFYWSACLQRTFPAGFIAPCLQTSFPVIAALTAAAAPIRTCWPANVNVWGSMMTKDIIAVAAAFMFALTFGILTADSGNDRASNPTAVD